MHPYEFIDSGDFVVGKADLRPLGRRAATYWRLRQLQWHWAGNKRLPAKLAGLIPSTGLGGRLGDQLEQSDKRPQGSEERMGDTAGELALFHG